MVNVNLTEKEIELLQCTICNQTFELRKNIEKLEGCNTTGINTNIINAERERVKALEEIWSKLYDANSK